MENQQIKDLILLNNNQLIAMNKPSGMPVQPDQTGDKSLKDLAEIYCKHPLHIVHRLDRPASGIVLFAKNKKSMSSLQGQLAEHKMQKQYLAVVKNKPAETSGTLQHYIRKNGKTKKADIFEKEANNAKLAELDYSLWKSSDNYHLLKIDLKTGRFHQIRAQLAKIGCPIKGDNKYGFKRANKDRSIQLHAWKLKFKHPISDEAIALEAALAPEPIWLAFS